MGENPKINLAFQKGFESNCSRLFVNAYLELRSQKDIQIKNLVENDISELFCQSINESDSSIKFGITVNTERKIINQTQLIEKGFADKLSRVDFVMQTIQHQKRFSYHVEAKILRENDKPLLKRYIHTGIDKFLSKTYGNGCLAGYLLEGGVSSTISGINNLLKADNRKSESLNKVECDYHDCYYLSYHKELENLVHLVFDFS